MIYDSFFQYLRTSVKRPEGDDAILFHFGSQQKI